MANVCRSSVFRFTCVEKILPREEKILLANILVCVEMFFFAIAHHWIFSWKPYADGTIKELMESRFRAMNNNQNDTEDDIIITWL